MTVVLIVLAVIVVLGSVAGVALSRRRSRGVELEPPPSRARPPEAPRPTAPAPEELVRPEDVVEEAERILAEPEAVEVVERPRFRDRLGKARALLSGYVGSVLSRTDIDDETWDELEAALIRAC